MAHQSQNVPVRLYINSNCKMFGWCNTGCCWKKPRRAACLNLPTVVLTVVMSCILNETRHSKRPQNARLYARSYGQVSFSFNREYSSTRTVVFGSGRDTRFGEQKINLTADSWLQHISCEKLHSNTKSRANSQHTRTFCASVLIIRKQNGRPRMVGKLYIYPTKLYVTVSNKKVFYSS